MTVKVDGRGFRVGDRVTVHNYINAEGRKIVPGRVLCINRKSRYMQHIVVLIDLGDCEAVECFCNDGSRYLEGQLLHMTLGWKGEENGKGAR